MSDLTDPTFLRQLAELVLVTPQTPEGAAKVCLACADEIERLRAVIDNALLDLTNPVDVDACRDELSRARREHR